MCRVQKTVGRFRKFVVRSHVNGNGIFHQLYNAMSLKGNFAFSASHLHEVVARNFAVTKNFVFSCPDRFIFVWQSGHKNKNFVLHSKLK